MELYNNGQNLSNWRGVQPIVKIPTEEQKQAWMRQIQEANYKLRMFAYVLYEKMMTSTYNLFNKLEDSGIWEEPLPKKSKRAKGQKHCKMYDKDISYNITKAIENIKRLNLQVQLDEKQIILKWGLAPFPLYIKDFGDEGSVYTMTSQRIANENTQNEQIYLEYAVRNYILNCKTVDADHKDVAVACMMVKCYEYIYSEMRKYTIESLKNIPLRREAMQTLTQSYKDFCFNIENIFAKLLDNEKEIDDKHSKNIADCCAGLVREYNSERMYQDYLDALKDTFSQYACYCIAKMILKVRHGKDLKTEPEGQILRDNFSYDDKKIDDLQKEFNKTRIDVSGEDAYDIKDLVPLMSNAPITKEFIEQFIRYE